MLQRTCVQGLPELDTGGHQSIACIFVEISTCKSHFHGDWEIYSNFRIFRTLDTQISYFWPEVSEIPECNASFPSWRENILYPWCLKWTKL